MTCPCKAELASIRSAIIEDVLAAAELCRTSGNKSGADAMDFLAGRISRPPSPAPAEPQDPCVVVEYPDGRFGIETKDSARFWRADKWHKYFKKNDPRWGWGDYTTRAEAEAALPAARAALLAASEPGKAAFKMPGPFTAADYESCPHCRGSFSYNRPREDGACPFCKKPVVEANPAPAPFDAAKWAEKMVIPGNFGMVAMRPHTGELGMNLLRTNDAECVNAVIEYWRSYLAAALRAAHEAGKAEAGQPRLRYEVLNAKKEVIAAFRDHYSATVFCNGLDGRSVVDTQPAPPAEKEPPHAN